MGVAAAVTPLGMTAAQAHGASPTPAPARPSDVLLPLFNNTAFNGQLSFCLGGASSHTAEVGEVLRLVQQVNKKTGNPNNDDTTTADFDTLVQACIDLGDRMERLAKRAGKSNPVSYRQRMMRASSYAAQALFFVLGTSEPDNEADYFRICQDRWLKSARMFDRPVEPFTVDSRYGEIPCYFFPSPMGSGKRPTLIVSSGSDGQLVECMAFGVTDGLARGYNVVLFEGPGQMSLLFEKQITFTRNWNKVIEPIVERVRRRKDVGAVGLVGVSFAGMLSSSAAAKVDLDATVLMPGGWNSTLAWGDQTDMNTVKQTHNLPPAQKAPVQKGLNEGFASAWPNLPQTTRWGISKRGEIYSRQVLREARAGKPVSNYYGLLENILPFVFDKDLRSITRPVMVTRNQGDQYFNGGVGTPPTPTTGKYDQPTYAYGLLDKVPARDKKFVDFTAAQGASLHDQPFAPQFANEVMFDWLAKYLLPRRGLG